MPRATGPWTRTRRRAPGRRGSRSADGRDDAPRQSTGGRHGHSPTVATRAGAAGRPTHHRLAIMSIQTPDWVRDAVFYQIFPDRFAISDRVAKPGPLEPWDAPPTTHGFKGGDLLGIVDRLPYLQDLGVTALYLTPIFQSAWDRRVSTYYYLAVDPLHGGDAHPPVRQDATHIRGIAVQQDGSLKPPGRDL